MNEFRASQRFAHEPSQILSTLFPNGLPDDLADLAVVHHAGEAWDSNALQKRVQPKQMSSLFYPKATAILQLMAALWI